MFTYTRLPTRLFFQKDLLKTRFILACTIGLFALHCTLANAQSWEVSTIPGSSDRFPVSFSVPNENTAWAYCWRNDLTNPGNFKTYFRTINAGSTWTQGDVPTACFNCLCTDIFAQNQDTAWVMFADYSGGGELYKTEDGGTSWKRKAMNTFNNGASFPNIIHFFDGKNGVMMGDPLNGYFEIYTTADAGENWTRVPSDNIPSLLNAEIGFSNVKDAIKDTIWFGTSANRIFRSINRGKTWTAAVTPFKPQTSQGDLVDISFKNAKEGFAVIVEGGQSIAKTTDGGTSWSLITTNMGFTPVYGLSYIPGTESSFVLSGLYTAYSKDDCKTWTYIDNVSSKYGRPAFFNQNTGYVGGQNSRILRWKPTTVGTKNVSPAFEYKIFPNPAIDYVNISATEVPAGVHELKLKSIDGKIVSQKKLSTSGSLQQEFDLSALPKGMYIISLGNWAQKLVKQ